MMTKILPLNKFRLLKEYKKHFPVTKDTIFAWDNIIYSNNDLPVDLVIHEQTHFKQQKEYGLKTWLKRYLNEKPFRLEMEKQAYINQINSIKDKGLKEAVIKDSITSLISGLYGKLTEKQAKELLGIKETKLDVNKLI